MTYHLPKRELVSQSDNQLTERADVPRSQFINRYGLKTAFDAGIIYPLQVEEILPGDHVTYDIRGYVRTAEPLFPLLDNQRIDIHIWYAPKRILWTNWEKFLGAQNSPGDSTNYTVPILDTNLPANGPAVGSLLDYMGYPTVGQITAGQGGNLIINNMPLVMYNMVWNKWYRSEDYQTAAVETTNGTSGSGTNYNNYSLLPRNKSHDYFTSILPAPQKGTAPQIASPVAGLGIALLSISPTTGPTTFQDTANNLGLGGSYLGNDYAYYQAITNYTARTDSAGYPQVYAETSIANFRAAIMMQAVLERDQRGGTRYVEQMKNHWGVTVPDYRLQRPEYVGGGSMDIKFTPVANTNADGTDPLGQLGAAGTADGGVHASYAAVEHGYIMIVASVKTELSYQQGIEKLWTRRTRWDYPIPGTMLLGEQAVLAKELYATGNPTLDNAAIGYQERWHEYRTKVSRVTGLMRSTAAGNIDEWHFAQQLANATIGDTFLRDTPPMTRVLAAGSAANGIQYKADFVFNRTITRPMPMFSTPAKLGKF